MIYRPLKGKYYGSQIAAPVFKEISDRIYANLKDIDNPPVHDTAGIPVPQLVPGMQKDIMEVYAGMDIPYTSASQTSKWVSPLISNSKVVLAPLTMPGTRMPNVVGMSIKDAVFLLEEMGLKVILTGKGVVQRQSVEPGKQVTKRTIVVLDLATVITEKS